jgi:hypothetical protein
MQAGSGTVSYARLNGVGMVVGTRKWLEVSGMHLEMHGDRGWNVGSNALEYHSWDEARKIVC